MSEGKFVPVGQRMVEVRVRFFTNKIAEEKGHIVEKNIWDNGMVSLKSNDAHGIESCESPTPFNSFSEIVMAIEEQLIQNGVKVHFNRRRMKKLMAEEQTPSG